ncbi:MAG TPA: AAA family ATPase [Gemmatimonadaceae bacterium]|nr:AAA family ATPase [Gemmatimonadaceae bacterium]
MSSPTPRSTPAVRGRGASRRPLRERRRVARLFVRPGVRGPLRFWPLVLMLLTLAAAGTLAWHAATVRATAPASVPYSELAAVLARGGVSELSVERGGSRLVATLEAARQVGDSMVTRVAADVPARAVSLQDLERWSHAGTVVEVNGTSEERGPLQWLQGLVLLAALGVVGVVLFRQRGVSSATRFIPTPPSRQLTLASVGGAREAQADLRDVIAYLKHPERFHALGARCPRGVLLIGPPGTGKTLLARAVAGEAGCPVIMAAGSDFNEMYVGVGAGRIRALAKRARESAPCIVFIDEFDSLGGRRGRPNRSGEEEVTLNQLLVEMDGMAGSEGVVWMAATNREDMLDPAVRRPGRFDRVVEVPLPTAVDRLEILRIHARQAPLGDDVDLERLAQLTVGHSGAELANLLNEAAILAVQDDAPRIHARHIEAARDKILLGRIRAGVVVSEAERRLIAIHEAGHAVVGLVACPEDRLHKVTIEPRGRSLGAAHFAPENDRHLYPRHYLEGIIAKALGGRAAELVFLGADKVTSGAGSDLVQATSIARRMVGEFGMSSEVGLMSADPAAHGGQPSAQLLGKIDAAVHKLLETQMARAESIVTEHKAAVSAIADALLARDVLPADAVHRIAAAHGVPLGPLATPSALAEGGVEESAVAAFASTRLAGLD